MCPRVNVLPHVRFSLPGSQRVLNAVYFLYPNIQDPIRSLGLNL